MSTTMTLSLILSLENSLHAVIAVSRYEISAVLPSTESLARYAVKTAQNEYRG